MKPEYKAEMERLGLPIKDFCRSQIQSEFCLNSANQHFDLLQQIDDLKADNDRLRSALIRLRDCDWVISLPDRMDAVREIAREALKGGAE